MHHSPGCHGGLLAAGNTLIGICAAPQQVTPIPTAPRTNEAIRPAALKQELGAVRFVRKPLLKCEERVRNGHRPRSCPVGGSESNQTWDNGISLRPGLGFKRFRTAWRTLVGYETLAMMRKGQEKGIGGDDIVAQAAFVNSLFDVAA